MHRRPVLPLGVKFDPTDAQLISGYLYPKFHRGTLPWNAIGFSDLVYEKPPWEFCTDLTAFPGDEKHYFFTERKKTHNRVVRTVGSYGTWHESSSKEISKGIGFKKLLNFKVKGEGKEMRTTDWLMHEFSLPDKKINLVLCVIQKKKKKKEKEEMGSAYDTNPELDPNSFLDLHSTTSAYVDPSPAPAPALDSEEEETRPSKKMRSDPIFDDDPFSGGDPCPAPALDSEEEETRPSKKMQSDPKSDDDPFSGGDPCPAHDDVFEPQAFAAYLSVGLPDISHDESDLLYLSGSREDVPGLPNEFGLPDDDFFDFQAPWWAGVQPFR